MNNDWSCAFKDMNQILYLVFPLYKDSAIKQVLISQMMSCLNSQKESFPGELSKKVCVLFEIA